MAFRVVTTTVIADPLASLGGETLIEEHLRISVPSSGAERTHVIALAEAALRHCIDITGRNPFGGTSVVYMPDAPGRLELPFKSSALVATTGAQYLNDAGAWTNLTVSDFGIYGANSPSVLYTKEAYLGPSDVNPDDPFPFRFTFTMVAETETDADGSTQQTPSVFTMAALMYLAHLYENRQAVVYGNGKAVEIPLAFDRLVKSILRIR